MKTILFLAVTFFGLISFAEMQIAFIEVRNSQGKIHQLEPGGRFAHIAIAYRGRWLHAHPYRGVELVDTPQLEKMGYPVLVSLPGTPDLTSQQMTLYLNKPYDADFTWESEGYYCSKLAGVLLGIEPEPMKFEADIWKNRKHKNGLGLSPDDLFEKVMSKTFRGQVLVPRCESLFH
jgi:hypothetical protein